MGRLFGRRVDGQVEHGGAAATALHSKYRISCEECTGGALSGRCSALALRRTGVAEELPLPPPAALAGGRLTGGRLMLGSGKCSACSSAPAGAPYAHIETSSHAQAHPLRPRAGSCWGWGCAGAALAAAQPYTQHSMSEYACGP